MNVMFHEKRSSSYLQKNKQGKAKNFLRNPTDHFDQTPGVSHNTQEIPRVFFIFISLL